MNDPLRIDVALPRAAGLSARPANDASTALLPAVSTLPTSPDTMLSPLALLLARFLPSHDATGPLPTPDEVRLLHGYLQQRIVTLLRAADIIVPPVLRVVVDADGALQLAPAPAPPDRVAAALHRDPDIARMLNVLQRAALADLAPHDGRTVAIDASARTGPRVAIPLPDARRAWPWGFSGDPASRMRRMSALAPFGVGIVAALLLSLWLLS